MLSLGAINICTHEYVYPKIANKKDKYSCPSCNKRLILCKGKVRSPYFRHLVDKKVEPCTHYSNPGESQIHKDAKLLLKTLLEKGIEIYYKRTCCECGCEEQYSIPVYNPKISNIILEHRFNYNGMMKIADVAYIDDNELLCLFEICNTHKTRNENRPEPWCEFDAKTLIELGNNNDYTSNLIIPCIRTEKCDACVKKDELKILKSTDLEKYVRIKLGQNRSINHHFISERAREKEPAHERFDFHAGKNITNNKKIIEMFHDDFTHEKPVFHSYKGGYWWDWYSNEEYECYNADYWGDWNKEDWYGGLGTVEIIIEMIKHHTEICDEAVLSQYPCYAMPHPSSVRPPAAAVAAAAAAAASDDPLLARVRRIAAEHAAAELDFIKRSLANPSLPKQHKLLKKQKKKGGGRT